MSHRLFCLFLVCDEISSDLQRLAGGEDLGFNNAVFLSEREAADRNYALGFYMREHKCYPEKTSFRECMDFYFQVRRFLFYLLFIISTKTPDLSSPLFLCSQYFHIYTIV